MPYIAAAHGQWVRRPTKNEAVRDLKRRLRETTNVIREIETREVKSDLAFVDNVGRIMDWKFQEADLRRWLGKEEDVTIRVKERGDGRVDWIVGKATLTAEGVEQLLRDEGRL